MDDGPDNVADDVADTNFFTPEKDVDADEDRDFEAVGLGLLPSELLGELTAIEDLVWVAGLVVILCLKFQHP